MSADWSLRGAESRRLSYELASAECMPEKRAELWNSCDGEVGDSMFRECPFVCALAGCLGGTARGADCCWMLFMVDVDAIERCDGAVGRGRNVSVVLNDHDAAVT